MKMMERMQTRMEESETKMKRMVAALQSLTKEPNGRTVRSLTIKRGNMMESED